MKKSKAVLGIMALLYAGLFNTPAMAVDAVPPAVAESLARDVPKLQFQGIQPTDVEGLYEVAVGTNVLYYHPKSGVVLFGELFSKDWSNHTAVVRSKLMASSYRNTPFDQSHIKSPVDGLCELVADQQNVVYYDPKSGIRLIGQMFTKEGNNLTAETLEKAAAAAVLKDLSFDKAITIGKGKNKVILFTDPDCPYCRKIEGYFKDRSDVTRYIYLLPLEQLHPKAADKSRVILCSKNKPKAFLDAMSGSLDTGELKPCSNEDVENTLNENKALAQKLGIRGTPYLIVNGVLIDGADTQRIEEALTGEGDKKVPLKKQNTVQDSDSNACR